jgi:zinc protease
MRKALALVLLLSAPAAAQKHYRDLVYPPLRELTVPEVERIELPNGLALYLLEDHSLPKVEGRALIRTGSRLEPAEKTGLASILGQVLRTGGSKSRPGEEVDRLLENAGASLETDIGEGSGTASLFTLREHLPLVLEILADLMRDPALPEDKIDLARIQERTGIARRNDDVSAIAGREFQKLLYGAASPYARTTEYATIEAITRDDLVSFHRQYFVPNRVLLGLWGDFDSAEVRALVERFFGSWERGPAAADRIPPAAPSKGGVSFIEKDDVNQTSLRIGQLGGRVDDPDYFALSVMAEILGGGFSSRLFQTVRSQRGLAYSVGASWNASYDHPGTFFVSSSTKSESTVESIRAIVAEIDRITKEPVSAEELGLAKDGILNSFVFNFDRKGEIVFRLMLYDYYGYPRDFLKRFQESVSSVTAEDVLRVARKNLRPDDLVVLAVGREDDFDAPLTTLGAVETIDVAIPPPAAVAEPEANPETLAKGAEVLRRFVASAGAMSIDRFLLEGESTLQTPQGALPAQVQVLFVAPDRYREAAILPFGEIVTVLDGDAGWVSTPRGVSELDADRRRRTREGIFRHYLGLLWAASKGQLQAQWLGTSAGSSEVLLRVRELSMRGLFDEASGRLKELSLPGTSLEGAPVEETRKFSAFETSGGLTVPNQVQILHDGSPAGETRFATQAIDRTPEPGLFTRPEAKQP